MHRSKTAVAAALLTVLALLPLAAAPVAGADPQANAKAEHDRIVKFWTVERMKSAKPRDFVKTPGGKIQPAARPVKPPKGGTTVTGASWTGGGPVVHRTGKVYFELDGSYWVCSASAVSNTRAEYSLVLTAAHCAYDQKNDRASANWMYMPSYDTKAILDCAQTQYGCWTAVGIVVHAGYADEPGFTTRATVHDFAIAIVGPGGHGMTQLEDLGTYGIAYPAISTGGSVHAFGYPAGAPYNGNDLSYCAGPVSNDVYNGGQTWGLECNMTGGSSGGPWLASFTTNGGGTLTSLNSYRYGGINKMFGPKFSTTTTKLVVDTANSAGTTYAVVGRP